MPQNRNTQSGSVLVYILIGVALFSMVMFSVTRGNNTSTTTMSKAQAKTTATEIIDYSNAVSSAVQKLISKGCSENEISFERVGSASFQNPNSPSTGDKKCWVFDVNGGNIRKSFTFSQGFIGSTDIPGIGTNCSNASCGELYLLIVLTGGSSEAICQEINRNLGNSLQLVSSTWNVVDNPGFTGTFTYHAGNNIFKGLSAACYKQSSTSYFFYHVLLAR